MNYQIHIIVFSLLLFLNTASSTYSNNDAIFINEIIEDISSTKFKNKLLTESSDIDQWTAIQSKLITKFQSILIINYFKCLMLHLNLSTV